MLLEFVRAEVADMLGHPSAEAVDVTHPFLELGFDSLLSVELRNRLAQATGLQLPTTVVFDHPTPEKLATHLLGRLPAGGSEHSPNASGGPGAQESAQPDRRSQAPAAALGALVRQARDGGRVAELVELLTLAARLRAEFSLEQAGAHAPKPIRLSTGTARTRIVCLPSLLAISGPHQYARFAKALDGEHEVLAIPLRGFLKDEPLPATMDAALEAHARPASALAAAGPIALAGHSTGGSFALAVAERMRQAGAAPAALVLIDTYTLAGGGPSDLYGGVLDAMLAREGSYAPLSDARLTAMARYLRLLSDSPPPPPSETPTLLVRASDPLPGVSAERMREQAWRSFDRALDVPGDHFTAMEDHAATTAAAVGAWLEELDV